jgi:hypothetical protein
VIRVTLLRILGGRRRDRRPRADLIGLPMSHGPADKTSGLHKLLHYGNCVRKPLFFGLSAAACYRIATISERRLHDLGGPIIAAGDQMAVDIKGDRGRAVP